MRLFAVLLASLVVLALTTPIWSYVLGALVGGALTIVAAIALFTLPGLALLRLCWPDPLALDERLCLASGLSCCVPPLLLLYAHIAGIGWSSLACLLILATSAVIAFRPAIGLRKQTTPDHRRTLALLLLISLSILAARFYTIRNWAAGGFGDSYHHTMIAQLLIDNGGLFRSWQPYAPLSSFTYHYGFHSLIAWLSSLSEYPTTLALLAIGQTQSALAAPAAYLLTVRLLENRTAGLWAAIFAGAVSIMPGYYVNWGRYTQLAGQTILVACVLVWATLIEETAAEQPRRSVLLRLGLLAAITTGGLTLTHYRVTIFAGGFVLIYVLYTMLRNGYQPAIWFRLLITGLIYGGSGLALALPWLLRTSEGALPAIYGSFYLANNIGTDMGNSWSPDEVARALPAVLVIPAILGLLLCLFTRRWKSLVLVGWSALLMLAANPYLIGLNGAGILSNFAVIIAGYLALAPLAGAAPALLGTLLARASRIAPIVPLLQLGAAALTLAWGLNKQAAIADPAFQLYTQADAAAMAWVRANTSPTAKFFVNSFGVYGNTLYAGSDGGWWIPFSTGRQSNLPPFLHGQEAGEQPDYQQQVAAENGALQAHPIENPATAAALHAAGYGYLYDGPAQNPPGEYIDPARLAGSPLYELVYQQDGVTIWRVRDSTERTE